MILLVGDDDLTTTVTLPVLIPIINIALSVTSLIAWTIVIRRVLQAGGDWKDGHSARLFFSAFLTMLIIVVAGAFSQAGLLSTPLWVMIGTGGRLIVALLGIVLAADRDLISASRRRE